MGGVFIRRLKRKEKNMKKVTKSKTRRVPVIICIGEHGRAVVFGYAARYPEIGKPCSLRGAKMILKWEGGRGLFGIPKFGPEKGSRITCAVKRVSAIPLQVLEVNEDAAKKIDEWPEA